MSKPNTLIFSMTYTKERESLFQWVGLIPLEDEISFWTLNSGKKRPPLNWVNVQGLTSAIPRQDSNLPLLLTKGLEINSNLYLVNSFAQAIDMLVKERVDYIVAGKTSLRYQIITLGYCLDKFTVESAGIINKQQLGFAFNLQSEKALVEKYRNAFRAMEIDGSLNDIMTKWLY
ncbi:substrate-binding periplasmic protein [Litorilituus lipolyticus]|uniref:Transporter substrate-binding domain-containing protein n=1 Tax=Litorilituus lipolyticus TaxID=2491017 RepID=A0A502L481_9GAMM|nr:ABC transporter substrate-binding protein [Litorilituus lipolyticus]TPH15107.1 transporter substrate-binding domain-containing protein [Litorilituus lipolyticus]